MRLDGKPHPKSFARLPTIPIFLNSDIASSWALRAEWKNVAGNNRARYIQSGGYNEQVTGAARGHTQTFLKSIAMIHYLFNVPVQDGLYAYMDLGKSNVIQAHYNHLSQEVTFDTQKQYPHNIDYSRVSERRCIQMMGDAGLQNMDQIFNTYQVSERVAYAASDTYSPLSTIVCQPKAGASGEVCEYCYDIIGWPVFLWTEQAGIAKERKERLETVLLRADAAPMTHVSNDELEGWV